MQINFSLPDGYGEKINSHKFGYESPSKTAKRLLMEFLDGKNSNALDTPQSEPAAMPDDFGDRLAKVEKLLDRQADIEEVLSDLTNQIAAIPLPETAIMIQKKPILPAKKAEVVLDHIEAAKEFERAVTTIKKWSVDPNKWPEGWIFDSDKSLWIKTA